MFLFIILLVLVFISLLKFNRTSLQSTHASLQSLKTVSILGCNKLKFIFSTSVVQRLFHLKELTVDNCRELEQVFDFPQEVAELEVPLLSQFLL